MSGRVRACVALVTGVFVLVLAGAGAVALVRGEVHSYVGEVVSAASPARGVRVPEVNEDLGVIVVPLGCESPASSDCTRLSVYPGYSGDRPPSMVTVGVSAGDLVSLWQLATTVPVGESAVVTSRHWILAGFNDARTAVHLRTATATFDPLTGTEAIQYAPLGAAPKGDPK